ncbi:MAG: type II secretion system GspH family protein [Actinomycetia bacterium]|nr:type II secretion system GspH family protein [Actinomycetes bacterium]
MSRHNDHDDVRQPSQDAGFTLVELLVAMIIIGVVSGLVVTAMTQASQTFIRADDETRGLADAKAVLDLVARDIRESRGVVCDGGLANPDDTSSSDPLCAAHLQLWIDDNSDYAQTPSEVVTWRLKQAADGEHFDVWRETGSGETKLVASSLIVEALFEYDSAVPQDASLVSIEMQYDARSGVGMDSRIATTSARVRNG